MPTTTDSAETLIATRRHSRSDRFCVCGEDHACRLHNAYSIQEAAVRYVALTAFWGRK